MNPRKSVRASKSLTTSRVHPVSQAALGRLPSVATMDFERYPPDNASAAQPPDSPCAPSPPSPSPCPPCDLCNQCIEDSVLPGVTCSQISPNVFIGQSKLLVSPSDKALLSLRDHGIGSIILLEPPCVPIPPITPIQIFNFGLSFLPLQVSLDPHSPSLFRDLGFVAKAVEQSEESGSRCLLLDHSGCKISLFSVFFAGLVQENTPYADLVDSLGAKSKLEPQGFLKANISLCKAANSYIVSRQNGKDIEKILSYERNVYGRLRDPLFGLLPLSINVILGKLLGLFRAKSIGCEETNLFLEGGGKKGRRIENIETIEASIVKGSVGSYRLLAGDAGSERPAAGESMGERLMGESEAGESPTLRSLESTTALATLGAGFFGFFYALEKPFFSSADRKSIARAAEEEEETPCLSFLRPHQVYLLSSLGMFLGSLPLDCPNSEHFRSNFLDKTAAALCKRSRLSPGDRPLLGWLTRTIQSDPLELLKDYARAPEHPTALSPRWRRLVIRSEVGPLVRKWGHQIRPTTPQPLSIKLEPKAHPAVRKPPLNISSSGRLIPNHSSPHPLNASTPQPLSHSTTQPLNSQIPHQLSLSFTDSLSHFRSLEESEGDPSAAIKALFSQLGPAQKIKVISACKDLMNGAHRVNSLVKSTFRVSAFSRNEPASHVSRFPPAENPQKGEKENSKDLLMP